MERNTEKMTIIASTIEHLFEFSLGRITYHFKSKMQDIGKKVSHIITNITWDDMHPIVEVTLIFHVSRVHIVYQNILI